MTERSRKAGAARADRSKRERYAVMLATLFAVLLMAWMAVLSRSLLLDRRYDEQLDLAGAMGGTAEPAGPPSTFHVDGAVAHCPAVYVGGEPVVVAHVSDVAVARRPCESSATGRRTLATAILVLLFAGALVVLLLAVWRLRRAAPKAASAQAL